MMPGDVYRVDLPETGGREQHGNRPAVVLQSDRYAARLSVVLIVPMTSTKAAAKLPGTVLVPVAPQNGLKVDSVALVFQLRALDRRLFGPKMGEIDAATLQEIYDELDRLTGHP